MSFSEVLGRLKQWKNETENMNVLYIQFDHLLIAMKGNNRNRRVIDDHEVGKKF
jgi:hypothetical protein